MYPPHTIQPTEMSPIDWDLFPDELLVSIFQYLEFQDLVSVSGVCQRWCRVFHEPRIWKSQIIHLSNNRQDLTEYLKVLRQIAHILAVQAQSLSLDGQLLTGRPEESELLRCRFLGEILEELTLHGTLTRFCVNHLLGNFNERSLVDTKKGTIVDTDDRTSLYAHRRNRVVKGLACFLKTQACLRFIGIQNSFLGNDHADIVMQSLVNSRSLHSLMFLDIANFYRQDIKSPQIREQLKSVLNRCKRLKIIILNYCYLRAVGVSVVCETLSESLETLVIETNYPEDGLDNFPNPMIRSEEWYSAQKYCPRLQVYFNLPKWRTDLRLYLVSGMPLVEVGLYLNSAPRYPDELGDTVSMLLYHVSKYFPDTLRLVKVSTRKTNPVSTPTKEAVVHCLTKCHQLKRLSLCPPLITSALIHEVQLEVPCNLSVCD